jgi:GH24 family phage-related lysozyme (muramidase)
LPEVRAYPDHIQEALLDLAYNLGPAGLMKWESLIAAVRKGDWETAATLAYRRQVSDDPIIALPAFHATTAFL